MSEKPAIIDAEFKVIGEEKPKQWGGLGKPPGWDSWSVFWQIAYLVIWSFYAWLAWLFAHWVGSLG
jgi:hypothetical protein